MPPWGPDKITDDGREQLRALGFNLKRLTPVGRRGASRRLDSPPHDHRDRTSSCAQARACCSRTRPSGSARATGSASSAATAPARPRSPRCSPASREPAAGHGHPLGRRRLPAAGPAHRRPRRARPRPHPVRARARRDRAPDARRPSSGWRRHRRRRPRQGDAALRPAGGRVHRRRAATPPSPRPPRSRPASACPSGCSASRSARSPAASGAASSSPGSCSAAPRPCCSTSRPTTSTPTRSCWLREFLHALQGRPGRDQPRRRAARGDRQPGLRTSTPTAASLDVYNVGWKAYLPSARPTSGAAAASAPTPRSRPTALHDAGRPDARQGHQGHGRPEHGRAAPSGCSAGSRRAAPGRQGRQAALPRARRRAARPRCTATGLSKSYGSLEVFTDVDLAIDRGSRVVVLGLNGAGKTTLLRMLAGVDEPDTGEVEPGHGLRLGYYAQEHETLDPERTVLENMRSAAPDLHRDRGAHGARARSCSPATTSTSRRGVLSGGEKTRLALADARRLRRPTCCCSTSPRTTSTRPAARRCSGRCARYEGAVVLVTHDEGAVDALRARARAPAARRRRGPLERRLPRPGRAGLIRRQPASPPVSVADRRSMRDHGGARRTPAPRSTPGGKPWLNSPRAAESADPSATRSPRI